jgi:hypothetical protein
MKGKKGMSILPQSLLKNIGLTSEATDEQVHNRLLELKKSFLSQEALKERQSQKDQLSLLSNPEAPQQPRKPNPDMSLFNPELQAKYQEHFRRARENILP